jgi:SAM-dependent methyltransferase
VTDRRFTGERLHEGDALFAVDLARHQAAYAFARGRVRAGRVLDLGSGSGHGAAQLGAAGARVVGVDRVAPDASSRNASALFVRADLRGLPFPDASFDLIVSFQVIEHLEDPAEYLEAIARLSKRDGLAILTTPNLLMSDRVNPYHVHEYRADELAVRLREYFEEVEMHGVGMSDPIRAHLAKRSRRIRRIVRLDPLRLRERLPAALVQHLFALFAVLVRRGGSKAAPQVSWCDFPIGTASDDCIDLLALCRRPR